MVIDLLLGERPRGEPEHEIGPGDGLFEAVSDGVDDARPHYIITVTLLCDGELCMPMGALGLVPLWVVLQSW